MTRRKPSKIYTRQKSQRSRDDRAGGTIPAHIAAETRQQEREFAAEVTSRSNKAAMTMAANLNACYEASGFTARQISKLTGIPLRTLNTILSKDHGGGTWEGLIKTRFENYAKLTVLFKAAGFGDGLDEARRQYL